MPSDIVLSVRGLHTQIASERGVIRAVDGIDFDVASAQTLALVGESGSGKSMTSLSIMGLLPRSAKIVSGQIHYRPRAGAEIDLVGLSDRTMSRIRGDGIAMIFQEPMTSLNPVLTIGEQIAEVYRLHRGLSRADARQAAIRSLERVEIASAARRVDDYPHHLSGGMRQRVMIATALACDPNVLIADEPTTALDVTVQAQILDLIRRLQRDIGMGILFITHNFGIVAEIADHVAVMQTGRIIEQASTVDVFDAPKQAYTRALLSCLPANLKTRWAATGLRAGQPS
jgi:peptide/nickel transport system ATP-binding protein